MEPAVAFEHRWRGLERKAGFVSLASLSGAVNSQKARGRARGRFNALAVPSRFRFGSTQITTLPHLSRWAVDNIWHTLTARGPYLSLVS